MNTQVNHVYNKVIEIVENNPGAKLLDLGSGCGGLSKRAKDKGLKVIALDADEKAFRHKSEIEFRQGDLNEGLPFEDQSFDYVTMLEVIEHLQNPYFVLREINRVLRPKGTFFLSTPNVLNLKSRFRFFFEGTYDYFREPPLELSYVFNEPFLNVHLFAYKYPELEYILFDTGFKIQNIFPSKYELQAIMLSIIYLPILKLHAYLKCRREKKKGGLDYSRIFKILLSPTLLYSRRILIKASKRT